MTKTTPANPTPTIIDCGILSETGWAGPVSAKALQDSGLVTAEMLKQAKQTANNYYVTVEGTARTRCIDGRCDPALDERKLGPQVPGGATGAALAYRIGVDGDDLTRGSFLGDAQAMIGAFSRHGLPIGGHRDVHSVGKETVGCGAIDAMDVVLARMTDPQLVDEQKRLVKVLLGDSFDRDTFLRDMGAAVVINGRADSYFRDRQKVIDMVEQASEGSVSTLEGTHQECLVIVNFVPNTTFATNRFANDFNGMQAFGYDVWRTKEIAQTLMPRDDQAQDRERFIMARVMTTVATLMALTDGSQRLLLRVPAPLASA